MAYEKFTVGQFMNAWFNEDYSEISKDEWPIVYAEYIDTAGLFISEEFDKVAYINFLNNKINSINIAIDTHRKFLETFGVAYSLGFPFFAKLGYIVKWNNDKQDFLNQLAKIELREKKNISQLEISIKELDNIRKSKEQENKEPEQTLKEKRLSFLRTFNSLNKIGYRIEKNSTTIEEYALMIKQQIEEVEEVKSKYNSHV